MGSSADEIGTAYRIRTGDLRLERAVSWASRRMRRGGVAPRRKRCRTGRHDTSRPADRATDPRRFKSASVPAAFTSVRLRAARDVNGRRRRRKCALDRPRTRPRGIRGRSGGDRRLRFVRVWRCARVAPALPIRRLRRPRSGGIRVAEPRLSREVGREAPSVPMARVACGSRASSWLGSRYRRLASRKARIASATWTWLCSPSTSPKWEWAPNGS